MSVNTRDSSSSIFNSAASKRLRSRRMLKDRLARYFVGIGGISAIIAIVLIFFYLLWVVIPLFKSADSAQVAGYAVPQPDAGQTRYLAMEEQVEIGVRYTDLGHAVFFKLKDGALVSDVALPLPEGVQVASVSASSPLSSQVVYGLSNGHALVVKHGFDVTYPDDVRHIEPKIEYPLGETPLLVDPRGKALVNLTLKSTEDSSTIVAATADGRVIMSSYAKKESMLEDEAGFDRTSMVFSYVPADVKYILLDNDQKNLYLANAQGEMSYFDISDKSSPKLVQRLFLVGQGRQVSSVQFLSGAISLIVGDDSGRLVQWFPVRGENNVFQLTRIREIHEQQSTIRAIAAEYGRKGFLAADSKGQVGIYYATSERNLLLETVTDGDITTLAVAPRANAMLIEDNKGKLNLWSIENEHPEISWSSLWGKVWYESYQAPDYIWQSTASSNDFEPKFSLVPVAFGTLKAAFYAMLVAMPLAILGAMYTAYFMSPRMRKVVKPSIEIMEALPTVILGFLAGLWLAPFMEKHLPGVFSLLLIMPVGIIACAFAWQFVPAGLRHRVPDGWEAALLILPLLLLAWISIGSSAWMEATFFAGDIRVWLSNEMGIDFDQRNAMVVGIAMGFAIIPNIFSIAEDAIFGVPRHLTQGSLALGATPWQTMWRVVLLTASPGIFSALMIGFGRAVGETMIVLMATGNTPVMDFSIFQGLRTLSANIAVEMPESEVNSTHYRVLFLAAFVLFMFTFFFNTLAELVRQRLRKKYSSL